MLLYQFITKILVLQQPYAIRQRSTENFQRVATSSNVSATMLRNIFPDFSQRKKALTGI